MKKTIDLSLRERNNLVRRNCLGKNRKKKIKKDKKRRKNFHQNNLKRKKEITLPESFDLHTNTDETLKIMGEFRNILDQNYKLKKLNFDRIKKINPSSALMLVAEIDIWNTKPGQNLRANHKTWNANVKALLCEMGFFELLGFTPLKNSAEYEKDTTFLKFISGIKSEGEKAKELRENIEKVISGTLENRLHLFDGLSEAFTNTTQHAYKKNSDDTNKWWITAAYKKDDKNLIVSMYDRGQGIPTTMKTGKKWGFLDERIHTKHSELLKIAMESSFNNKNTRTQTGKKNRGKGLKQLLDFIKGQGQLTIISNKGYCIFKVNNDNLSIIEQKELKYPLQGTLIEWNIDLLQVQV